MRITQRCLALWHVLLSVMAPLASNLLTHPLDCPRPPVSSGYTATLCFGMREDPYLPLIADMLCRFAAIYRERYGYAENLAHQCVKKVDELARKHFGIPSAAAKSTDGFYYGGGPGEGTQASCWPPCSWRM